MSDALKKVKPGDPLKIPASTFNTLIDVARAHRQRQHAVNQQPRSTARDGGTVLLRNDSAADRQRFDILGLGDPVILPDAGSGAEQQFKNAVALRGVAPAASSHKGRFAVLAEPLTIGAIGKAIVSGVTPARLYVEDESFGFADINDADPGSLKTCRDGSAQILWRQSGTGLVWGVVKLGVAILGTHASPKVLGGSGATADAETWDADNQPAGCDGVRFTPFRLHWSGLSGEPVYQFVRTPTYDSLGRLVAVSAEVRSVAFNTDNCEGA
jgi:hypothetical protein